jgi:hypothetical protein
MSVCEIFLEVIHGECSGGMNNPWSNVYITWFYANKDGIWYCVEIGKYEQTKEW